MSKSLCNACLKKNRSRNAGGFNVRRKYSLIKTRAKVRGVQFDMQIDEFEQWYSSQPKSCYYCGVPAQQLNELKRSKSIMSVDRKDNSTGYLIENLCLACFRCNNMKSNFFTSDEWKEIASRYIMPRINEYHA